MAELAHSTARHPRYSSMKPPSTGAKMGASPSTVMRTEKMPAAAVPWATSLTLLKPMTRRRAPASPCMKRLSISMPRVSEQPAQKELAAKSTSPDSSGILRPKRSMTGPQKSWPAPEPAERRSARAVPLRRKHADARQCPAWRPDTCRLPRGRYQRQRKGESGRESFCRFFRTLAYLSEINVFLPCLGEVW